jgi:transposase-like protein
MSEKCPVCKTPNEPVAKIASSVRTYEYVCSKCRHKYFATNNIEIDGTIDGGDK